MKVGDCVQFKNASDYPKIYFVTKIDGSMIWFHTHTWSYENEMTSIEVT